MNIIGTGLSGLVGSRVVELLAPTHTFEDLSLSTGVDITNNDVVRARIGASSAPWVFHFAAYTDVDGAEKERAQGEKSTSWKVNVVGTESIVAACRETGKKLLYISTDYVFDGTAAVYTETTTPNPQGWYGLTKYEGEKRVAALGDKALIVRIANPYRKKDAVKADFVHKILSRLSGGQPVTAPSDQQFVPTFIDDIATALSMLVTADTSGIVHVVGADALSPYDCAQLIARTYRCDEQLVSATTFAQYFQSRAPRPFRAVMRSDRISQLGIRMSDFATGIQTVFTQETV